MSKYIIKNCPICELCDWDNGYGELEEGYLCKRITIDSFECKDIEHCLLKQIVEKCKDARRTGRKAYLPIEILDLLQIQEVE